MSVVLAILVTFLGLFIVFEIAMYLAHIIISLDSYSLFGRVEKYGFATYKQFLEQIEKQKEWNKPCGKEFWIYNEVSGSSVYSLSIVFNKTAMILDPISLNLFLFYKLKNRNNKIKRTYYNWLSDKKEKL